MADMAEVQTSTGNIRGNHEVDLVSAKTLEDRGSPRLVQASVDKPYGFKYPLQLPYQFLGLMSCIAKDDGLGDLLPLQICDQGIEPISSPGILKMVSETLRG